METKTFLIWFIVYSVKKDFIYDSIYNVSTGNQRHVTRRKCIYEYFEIVWHFVNYISWNQAFGKTLKPTAMKYRFNWCP